MTHKRIVSVAANGHGDVFAIDGYDRIWISKAGWPGFTTPTNGLAISISAVSGHAFCVNRQGQLWGINLGSINPTSTNVPWIPIPGVRDINYVSLSLDYRVYVIENYSNPIGGRIRRSPGPWPWPEADNQSVGFAIQVSAYDKDTAYCINGLNEVYFLSGGNWQRWGSIRGRNASVIPVSSTTDQPAVWLVGDDGQLSCYGDGGAFQYKATGGKAVQVAAVSATQLWAVNADGQLWDWNQSRNPQWLEHKLPFPTEYYVVKAGDTLSGIALQFGTTVSAIVNANPGVIFDPDLIFVGQVLVIP